VEKKIAKGFLGCECLLYGRSLHGSLPVDVHVFVYCINSFFSPVKSREIMTIALSFTCNYR
jgi:hypothetical protein